MVGIYKITSPTGKVYIGQSWNIEDREKDYRPGRCKNQKKINSSIRKYGWKSHIFEVVQEFPKDINQNVLDNYEEFFVNQFIEAGYEMMNLKMGGKGGGKHSEETKRIIGIQSKERFKSVEDYEIYQYDLNLNLVRIWNDSILDICKKEGYSSSGVGRALSNNSDNKFIIAHGFFWFYKKDIDRVKDIDLKRIKERANKHGRFSMYW